MCFAEGQWNHAKLNENVLKLFLFPLSGDAWNTSILFSWYYDRKEIVILLLLPKEK